MDLSYILEKIRTAEFSGSPFRHLEINDLFNEGDLAQILASPEIAVGAKDDLELFQTLFENNYKIIPFPGCTENHKEYLAWHKDKAVSTKSNTSCEGYGVVMRLDSAKSSPIETLINFINSDEFVRAIADKFDVDASNCTYDAGLQKYLDGYEISPHPDIRKKALTYMVNINPSPTSIDDDHHTSYLKFKPQWRFVEEFWKGNTKLDRCWVPWDWCEIEKQQRKNNSLVMFSPNDSTLHAVKAKYDHLANQRTQLYGNLWYQENMTDGTPNWEEFVIKPSGARTPVEAAKRLLRKHLPDRYVTNLRNMRFGKTRGKRNV